MKLLHDIQQDIYSPTVSLASIMRKSLTLAYKLPNAEFKTWISNELNGYRMEKNEDITNFMQSLPRYRVIHAEWLCNMGNQFRQGNNLPIVVSFLPLEMQAMLFLDGIPSIERLIEETGTAVKETVGREILVILDREIAQPQGYRMQDVWKQAPKSAVVNIIETVRSSLLQFLLELESHYPKLEEDTLGNLPRAEIAHIYNITIASGGNMSVFDQNNQHITGNQYNAARDINFGNVSTKDEFVAGLEEIQRQLESAQQTGELDEEVSTDVNYHLTKAVQQAKKANPSKEILVSHLTRVKEIAKGILGLAGIIATVGKAIEVLDRIF